MTSRDLFWFALNLGMLMVNSISFLERPSKERAIVPAINLFFVTLFAIVWLLR